VDHPEKPERFDEGDAALLEFGKLRIALDKQRQFPRATVASVGEEEPEVLDGRTSQAVVKIDDEEALIGSFQDVSPVEVSMDADPFEGVEPGEDGLQRCVHSFSKIPREFGVNQGFEFLYLPADKLLIKAISLMKDPSPTRGVDSSRHGPKASPILVTLCIELTSAVFWKKGKGKNCFTLIGVDLEGRNGLAVAIGQGNYGWNIEGGAVCDKAMLLGYSLLGPAAGTIELGDIALPFLPSEPIYAIDIA
jgi:hypothetical protein